MRRRFPTNPENYPVCPACASASARLTVLMFESASFCCQACGSTWEEANEEVGAPQRGAARRSTASQTPPPGPAARRATFKTTD